MRRDVGTLCPNLPFPLVSRGNLAGGYRVRPRDRQRAYSPTIAASSTDPGQKEKASLLAKPLSNPFSRDTCRWENRASMRANTRFSVIPPDGAGNCNVVARPSADLATLTQAQLNREVDALPMDRESWAGYAGLPLAQTALEAHRRSRIVEVPAIVGTLETSFENLEGKVSRKQFVAVTLTPGYVWTLNCGVSTFRVK